MTKPYTDHPSVRHSTADGAIGVMGVKKTRDGVFLYFGHNTDSFVSTITQDSGKALTAVHKVTNDIFLKALASMHSDESKPVCTMSRSAGNGMIAQGGRAARYRPRH